MKIVITSFGSSGDFNPCLGIARSLRGMGADVVFVSNPFYEEMITGAGVRFWAAGEYFDVFEEIRNNPVYLHRRKGPAAVWKLIMKILPETYFAMKEVIEAEKPDLAVCHLLEYGGMLAACDFDLPFVILSPNPMCWVNTVNPGYYTSHEHPAWMRRVGAIFMRTVMSWAFKYSLVPRCKKNGFVSPVKSLKQLYESAEMDLGLWSETLRGRLAGDPEKTKICGFVRDEHIKEWDDVPDEIVKLFECEKKPVVVGMGSIASLHGEDVYAQTVKACRELGRGCLLVGKDLSKYSAPEDNIHTVDFAPYGWVFPRAGLIIHHGGVNTTAETLRSGVPGLVVPHGYDQFDNAIRAMQMGAARKITFREIRSEGYASVLGGMLDDAAMHEKAKEISQQICPEADGADAAAEVIMSIGRKRRG